VKLLTVPERLAKRVLEEILGLYPAPHHLGEEPTKTRLTRDDNPLDFVSGKRRRQMGDPAVLPALGSPGRDSSCSPASLTAIQVPIQHPT
jgi:hypothetical protein